MVAMLYSLDRINECSVRRDAYDFCAAFPENFTVVGLYADSESKITTAASAIASLLFADQDLSLGALLDTSDAHITDAVSILLQGYDVCFAPSFPFHLARLVPIQTILCDCLICMIAYPIV
jgi:hypothetical protein